MFKKPARFVLTLQTVILASAAGDSMAIAGVNSWTTSGPTTAYIESLMADPSSESGLYAGAYGPLLFKLNDDHWERVADGTPSPFRNLNAIAVDPKNPKTIYVGVSTNDILSETGGIYKSGDAGRTWVLGRVHQDDAVISIVVDPVNQGTVYAVARLCVCIGPPRYCLFGLTCTSGIYKSTDSGLTWTRQGELEGATALAIDPLTPTTLYAIAGQGVFKSLDGGLTWTEADSGITDRCPHGLAVSPTDPNVLFIGINCAGPVHAVYRSSNGGASWKPTALTLGQAGSVSSIAVDPTNEDVVYVAGTDSVPGGTAARLFRSTNGGESWIRFDKDLPDLSASLVAVEPDGRTVHVSIYPKGVFDYTYSPPLMPRVRARDRTPTTLRPR